MRGTSDSRLLRLLNGQRIMDAMFDAAPGAISRADLTRVTGLSKPTVSALVGDLDTSGVVRQIGPVTGSGAVGRPAALYEVVPEAGFALGVDVGGTKIILGIANLLGDVVAEREVESGPDAEAVLAVIAELAIELQAEVGCSIEAACVGVPGVYRRETDAVHQALNLPGFDGIAIRARLEEVLSVDVNIDNDVNLAALGEADNAGDDFDLLNFAAISIGTGIGMGLVVNGELNRGGFDAAGEIGSLAIGVPSTDSSSRVTLEDLASATAMKKRFRMAVESGEASSLEGNPDVPEILAAASDGDAAAVAVLEVAASAMATAVSHLCLIADPETIIFGGGVGANEVFVRAVESSLRDLSSSAVELVASTLGRRATFLGAVSCAVAMLHETLVTQRLEQLR